MLTPLYWLVFHIIFFEIKARRVIVHIRYHRKKTAKKLKTAPIQRNFPIHATIVRLTSAGIPAQITSPVDRSMYVRQYASKSMSSVMSKWRNLSAEQIAVSTVLSHISQFEIRVQRLLFTQNITNYTKPNIKITARTQCCFLYEAQNDHNHTLRNLG